MSERSPWIAFFYVSWSYQRHCKKKLHFQKFFHVASALKLRLHFIFFRVLTEFPRFDRISSQIVNLSESSFFYSFIKRRHSKTQNQTSFFTRTFFSLLFKIFETQKHELEYANEIKVCIQVLSYNLRILDMNPNWKREREWEW